MNSPSTINFDYSKKRYHQFCKSEKELPVFFKDWYLDAVSQEGKWDVIMMLENDEIIAVLPYYHKTKAIFHYMTMPHLCFQLGPYFVETHRNRSAQLLEKLLLQLPKFDFIEQRWHYSILSLPSGISKNYTSTQRYSYRIDDLSDLTKVYNNISRRYRNNKIKKARQRVEVKTDLSIENFYQVNKMTFDRQGIEVPYSLQFIKQLDAACQKNNARKIFYAIDKAQQIHSALYLIWDKRSSYLLMSGDDPNLRKSAAGILLTWEAIQFTKNELALNVFDFEGSMIPSVERVRKSFGAKPHDYLQINQHRSKLFKWINALLNA